MQIALDHDFNNIANSITNVRSTRYSPPVTLNNDQFWWRVRAVDLAGQPTSVDRVAVRASSGVAGHSPQPVYPLGHRGHARHHGTKPFFQWTPVQHASTTSSSLDQRELLAPAVDQDVQDGRHDLHAAQHRR